MKVDNLNEKVNVYELPTPEALLYACKESLRMYKSVHPSGGWQHVEDILEYVIDKAEKNNEYDYSDMGMHQ